MATRSTRRAKTRQPVAKRGATAKPRAKKVGPARRTAVARRTPAKRTPAKRTPAKRIAAKKAVVRGRKAWCSDAEGYMVYESPIAPRHFTVQQIRRAVKAVANG